MSVLGSVTVPVFIHLAVLEILGTILLCYSTAVLDGHVPAWLPMISDCFVLPPERYPARLGVILGAGLLQVEVLLIYFANKGFSRNSLGLVAGTVASVGLGVVGAVNEQENNTLHSGFAVLFFLGYELYMITMTLNSIHDRCVSWTSLIVKKLCMLATTGAIIAALFMSTDWGKYHLYIAVSEWTATFSILLFRWTFALDLTELTISETTSVNDSSKGSAPLLQKKCSITNYNIN